MQTTVTIPTPALDEQQRLAALYACEILDSLPEAEFDDLVELAQRACGTPAAAISFIDSDRQWLKAARGVDRGVAREHAFCNHTIQGSGALVVPDASADPRFRDNPYVAGAPGLRFYAGVPLVTAEGAKVGALCVLDGQPRALEADQLRVLEILARQVATLLELRRQKAALQEALAERGEAVARLELAEAVRTALLAGPGGDAAMQQAVAALAQAIGAQAGALWRVRSGEAPLQLWGGYWLASPAQAPIEAMSQHVVFSRGVGLPGAAWRAGRPVWLANLLDEPGLLRVAAARAAGLSAGVAVPVVVREQVVGVVELLFDSERLPDDCAIERLQAGVRELGAWLAAGR